MNQSNRTFLTTKNVFKISLYVVALTIIAIWLFGLGKHRSLYENSILSTTILSIAFFLFLTINLYRGVKLKDDLGKITDKIDTSKILDFPDFSFDFGSAPSIGEGIGGIIVSIILWIIISIVLAFLISILGSMLWMMILVFAAMLYWIFYRALRFAFRHSKECKSNLIKSTAFALLYTVVYNFWIYGIILMSHYLT